MDNEKLRSVPRNKYDGTDVWRTKNCDECPYRLEVYGDERCYWGVAWKKIYQREDPRKCMKIDKPSPRAELLAEIETRDSRISVLGVKIRQLELFLS